MPKRFYFETSEEYIASDNGFEDRLTGDPEPERRQNELAPILKFLLEDNLTKKQKCYIMLYYRDGLTVTQIAERFGVAPSTVSRTVTRGRKRLADGLKREALKKILRG